MIRVDNLSKVFRVHRKDPGFRGSLRSLIKREWIDKIALGGVSFEVNEGEIVGLVGANGAGKTTLVKLLSGIIHPSAGSASVLGFVPWERRNEFRRQIGLLMGQKAQLWWDLPAADSFILLREIYGVSKADSVSMLNYLAETLNVTHLLDIPVRRLSLGERMKMELIAVLLHRPKILYLDEPTIGLDITSQKAIRRFLLDYSDRYKPAMLITSHYMEDIEQLCKRIIIIREGAFVYDGALEKVLRQYATHKFVTVHLKESLPEAEVRRRIEGILLESLVIEDDTLRLKVRRESVAETMGALLRALPVQDLSIEEEDIASVIEALMNKPHESREVAHVAG